jgi:hypothetical protein
MIRFFRFGAFAPFSVLFLSLSFLVLTWDRPGVNGDEFNFLWPLLTDSITNIGPFKWAYFGPLKTYITYPILVSLGFDVGLFRTISIVTYCLFCILLFRLLWKKKLFIASMVLIMLLSINADLLHYAKSDRNASTFVLLTAILMVLAIDRLYRKKTAIDFAIASVAILIALNTHLRNIWLLNSAFAAITIYVIAEAFNSKNSKEGMHENFWFWLRSYLAQNKLLFLSYIIGIIYFFAVYFYFRDSPETQWAMKMGEGINIIDRIGNATSYLVSSFSGADILQRPSAEYLPWQAGGTDLTRVAKYFAVGFALIIFGLSFVGVFIKIKCNSTLSNIENFFIISFVVFSLSAVQYLFTKTAALPYHQNIVIVSMLVLFSVSAELVYRSGFYRYARGISIACIVGLYLSTFLNYMIYSKNVLQTPTNITVIKPAVEVMKARSDAQYILFDWFVGPAIGLTYKFDSCCFGDIRRVGAVGIYGGSLPTDSDSFVLRTTQKNSFYGMTGLTDEQLFNHGQSFLPTQNLPMGFQFGLIVNHHNPALIEKARQ